MSETEKKPNNNRRRHRPKKKSKASGSSNKGNSQGNGPGSKASGKGPNAKKRPNSRNSNNKRRFYKKKKTGPKLTGEDYIAAKYFNLLDQHLNARKKYFENFNLVDKKTQAKLEKNFIESQKTFLAFKSRLNDKDKKLYEEKFENLKLDTTYSKNHDIAPTEHLETNVDPSDIQDPHYLVSQIESDFSDDEEESMGSLDDYKAYKGQ